MTKAVGAVKNAGFQHASIYRVNSSFVPMGTAADPNTIADGTTLHALHIAWPDVLTMAQPTAAVEKTQGGNQPGPSVNLGTSDRGEATLTLAMENETLSALIEEVTNDAATASDWLIKAHNPRIDTFHDYGVILSGKVVGDGITEHWTNKIYLNCKLQITSYMEMSQAAGTNTHTVTITLTPNESTKTPWAALLSTTALAVTDNKTDFIEIRTDAPLSVTTYVATITTPTQYILGFRPTTADVLQVSQLFTLNGAVTNPTSVSITTGVVEIAAPAPSASDEHVACYETNFVAI